MNRDMRLTLDSPDQALLELWFALSDSERRKQFMDTRSAAQLAAVSQRTIRFWIESGLILAIHVGYKYQIQIKSLREFITTCALTTTD